MKNKIYLLFSAIALVLFVGCKSGPCPREGVDIKQSEAKTKELAEKAGMVSTYERVKVYKPDGTLQCNQGKQIPMAEMAKQLAGIQIFSQENLSDGMMRIQVCGAPTGQSNVYEIPKVELKKAIGLGFKEWLK